MEKIKTGSGKSAHEKAGLNVASVTTKKHVQEAVSTKTDDEIEDGAAEVEYENPVFQKYGPPFLAKSKSTVTLNERAIAVHCATKYKVRYIAETKSYQRYDEKSGLWKTAHLTEIHALLGELLYDLGQEFKQVQAVQLAGSAKLNSLSRMLQPFHYSTEGVNQSKLFHVSNGILDLSGKAPVKVQHDPKYNFTHSSGVEYDPKAKCPRFLGELLEPALLECDRELVQKYSGSVLLGTNQSHKSLLLRGEGGSGKSTFVNILEKGWGENVVAELRTKHMTSRFETSAFLGKSVLVGKDVPSETLQEKGAHMLKSLTGGDRLDAEIKYNPSKQKLTGDFHVVIVSNNHLKLALDGDLKAWERRLLVVDFNKPKTPKKRIVNFADELFKEEASGILNWMIEGALKFQADIKKTGTLSLNQTQLERIQGMLYDSDSAQSFVEQCVSVEKNGDVTTDELLLGYFDLCNKRNWKPVSSHEFLTRLPDLIGVRFKVCRRNDIMRNGKAARGFKRITLN